MAGYLIKDTTRQEREQIVTTLIICMWQSWKSHVNMNIQLAGLQ